jgi:hypothetical protein
MILVLNITNRVKKRNSYSTEQQLIIFCDRSKLVVKKKKKMLINKKKKKTKNIKTKCTWPNRFQFSVLDDQLNANQTRIDSNEERRI